MSLFQVGLPKNFNESDINQLINPASTVGPIDCAIYNEGNMFSGQFLNIPADSFKKTWSAYIFVMDHGPLIGIKNPHNSRS